MTEGKKKTKTNEKQTETQRSNQKPHVGARENERKTFQSTHMRASICAHTYQSTDMNIKIYDGLPTWDSTHGKAQVLEFTHESTRSMQGSRYESTGSIRRGAHI